MERISEPRPNIRLALVGGNAVARHTVGRRMEKLNFDYLSVQDPVLRVLRILYGYKKQRTWAPIKWETRYRVYDAVYSVDDTIWVNYLKRRLENITRDVVVPDCRYLNEIQELRKEGFTVIRVISKRVRKYPPASAVMTKIPGKIALSEYYSRGFDELLGVKYSINQDDTAGLRKATDEIVEKLRRERDT